jgi:hypothetical protein
MSKSKEVANWQSALAAEAKQVAEVETTSGGYISLKGGCMTYKDEAVAGNALDVIVVANVTERSYYDRPYDPDDQGPPTCFAQAVEVADLAPHSNVPTPANDTCKGCPKAEFGTALQGKGPACKTRRKLAVMPVSALQDGIADAEIATMAVPPTSVGNFQKYIAKMATTLGLPPWAFSTTVSCAPHPKKQFEVSFAQIAPVAGDEYLGAIHARIEEATKGLMRPYEYDQEAAPAASSEKF